MDINTIGVATVAAIIVICYLIGMIVKATALDSKWIPIICGVCGGIIGALALAFHMPDFPADDYFTAVAVGIMSAQIGGLPIAVFALTSEVTLGLKNTLILYKNDFTTTLTATETASA